MFTGLIEFLALAPLVANFIAFCAAVVVSFFGHFHWTFRGEAARQQWPSDVLPSGGSP
jgi:putative flippase GtrA